MSFRGAGTAREPGNYEHSPANTLAKQAFIGSGPSLVGCPGTTAWYLDRFPDTLFRGNDDREIGAAPDGPKSRPYRPVRLLRQPVEIDAAVIVGHVDLTAVDYRRVELVEQKLDVPLLRVP